MEHSYGNVKFDLKFETGTIEIKTDDDKFQKIVLDSQQLSDICLGYERMCTANYLMSNYGVKSQKRAWKLAHEVREQMDEYGMTESEAIDEVL